MSFEVSSKSVGSGCCSNSNVRIFACRSFVGKPIKPYGKLFQIRDAVELNARPANTVLSVGWDSSWWSDDWS